MKIRNILTAFVFLIAIGSAVASELLLANSAYARKVDVPLLSKDCEIQGVCQGTQTDCLINFSINGFQFTGVHAYDGADPTTCGNRLKMNSN